MYDCVTEGADAGTVKTGDTTSWMMYLVFILKENN